MSEHHVGAVALPIPDGVHVDATLGGANEQYRYRLEWWKPQTAQRSVLWLMMNPSVADHHGADRTVLKCWRYSQGWGFTHMLIGNSAAYRATDQGRLAEVSDPVGPDNMRHLLAMAAVASLIVIAYGKPKVKAARLFGPQAERALGEAGHKLHALALSNDGTPQHPLFLGGGLTPQPYAAGRFLAVAA